ncbi:MAG: TonB-dependent receptor [Bacteroidota bacterium]
MTLLFVQTVCAQHGFELDSSLIVDEVIVTATRQKKALTKVPSRSVVITSESIESSGALRLSDILNEQTGLITVPDFGGGEGIQMQGMDSEYVLIMIDGTPIVGRTAGTLDLSRITVQDIEQVEIIKGASSSLYGNEALGGVINVITKSAEQRSRHTNVRARYGSQAIMDLSLSSAVKFNNLIVDGQINHYRNNGFDLRPDIPGVDVNPFHNITSQIRASYHVNDSWRSSLTARFFDQHQKLNFDGSEGESTIDEYNLTWKLSGELSSRTSLHVEMYNTNYQAQESLQTSRGVTQLSFFDQTFTRPELRVLHELSDAYALTGGSGVTIEQLSRSSFAGDPEFISPYAYLQVEAQPTAVTDITVGLRYDDHSEYQDQLSPKLGIKHVFTDKLSGHLSIGYGYKAPAFRQLYFDFTNSTVGYTVLGTAAALDRLESLSEQGGIINQLYSTAELTQALEPETSRSVNLGVNVYPTDGIKITLNAYRNDISNLIDTRVIARKTNGQNVFSYYNANQVRTQGIEMDLSVKSLDSPWKFALGYQYLEAKDLDVQRRFEQGEVFARESTTSPSFQLNSCDYFGLFNRSPHMVNVRVDYDWTELGLHANVRGTYRSSFGLFDTNSNGVLDSYDDLVSGYMVWDLTINKNLGDDTRLAVGVDNALDFTNAQFIPNIPGRLFYTSVQFKL